VHLVIRTFKGSLSAGGCENWCVVLHEEINNDVLDRGCNSRIRNSKAEQLHKLYILYSTTEEIILKIMNVSDYLTDMRDTLESIKHFPVKIHR
jgi:hypothetical protein